MPIALRILIAAIFLVIVTFVALSIVSRRPATGLGMVDGRLAPCGSKPNCVSSEGGATRAVAALPLPAAGDPLSQLAQAVERLPRTKVVDRGEGYLRAESRTLVFRFVDDLELRIDRAAGVVQVRSGSRVGYSDRGENRRRVEALRALISSQP